MRHFIDSTMQCLDQKNWFGALAIALTLPDICARLADPTKRGGQQYIEWFDKYVGPAYRAQVGPDRIVHTFLGGSDCYALRCAFLHQGEFSTDQQKAQETLNIFHFVTPPEPPRSLHMNQIGRVLELQVDVFCSDMSKGVENWMLDVASDATIQGRIGNLGKIHQPRVVVTMDGRVR